jgi:hypothetical protein
MNKAAIESYLRNLAGQVIGAVMIVIQTSGIASPIDFGLGEWLLVANALWASIIPTALRWLNKKDPAFGVIAEVVAKEVGKKLASEAAKAKKPVAKKPATKSAPKATGTKKATTKK